MDALIGWPGGDWQATARLSGTLVGGYLIVLWATSVLWVYRDIRARTRDPVSQLTAVAIAIVFPLVSLPIYAALRPPETLQDAYLRLLEREVLLSELGSIQETDPRRPSGGGDNTSRGLMTPAAPVPPPSEAVAREQRLSFDEPQRPSRAEARSVDREPPLDLERVASEFAAASESPSLNGDDDETFEYEDEPVRHRG
ncbi:MAG: hypothetical protein DWG75_02795 [Chloroflexi bacterium]|nr:hypothetical protein [Chloroflexota bacterium]